MADADEEQWGDAVGGEAPRPGSRASRSLGLLCARFLELYSATHICGESHLSLDHAATSLGVERRRMYDVVGILEACEVVVRRGKNSYTCAPRPCAASAPRPPRAGAQPAVSARAALCRAPPRVAAPPVAALRASPRKTRRRAPPLPN
jgi:hypothetical protein